MEIYYIKIFKIGNTLCRIWSFFLYIYHTWVPTISKACPCYIHPVSGPHKWKSNLAPYYNVWSTTSKQDIRHDSPLTGNWIRKKTIIDKTILTIQLITHPIHMILALGLSTVEQTQWMNGPGHVTSCTVQTTEYSSIEILRTPAEVRISLKLDGSCYWTIINIRIRIKGWDWVKSILYLNPNPTSQQSPITDSGRGKGPNLDPGRNKGPALGQNQGPNTFITKFYTYILDIHFYM